MNKKRLCAVALTGALLTASLSGCTSAPLFADPGDMAYKTAGVVRDSAFLTVDGQDITAEEYLFWLLNAISGQKQNGYLADDTAWETTLNDVPTAEELKNEALETAKVYRIIETKAAEMGVTLSEENQTQLDSELQQVSDALGGDDALQTWLDDRCISREGFTQMNAVYYLNQGIQQKLTEDGTLTPTDESMAAFFKDQGVYAAKHILISTRTLSADGQSYEEFTDEEKAAALTTAQDYCAQIAAAGDTGAKFDELMNAYSADGRDADGNLGAPDGYVFLEDGTLTNGQGALVTEFVDAAKALEIGQVSQPVQTDYGYHIIMRVDPDSDEMRSIYPSYKLNVLTQEWMDAAEVTTTAAYDALDPKSFYDKLNEIITVREEKAAEEAAKKAAESPAESPAESAAESAAPAESALPTESAAG